MIIGVDLDDVLLDFNGALCSFHNRHYGTSYKPEDATDWNIDKIWKCGPEEAAERILAFYESSEHFEAAPIIGSVQAIAKLKEMHTLHVVTAKPANLRQMTVRWVDRHFPGMFDGVHFTSESHGDNKKTKAKVCDELGVQIFIDDNTEKVQNVADSGRPVLLFDRPWNQGYGGKLITRVHSWEEIAEKLKEGI